MSQQVTLIQTTLPGTYEEFKIGSLCQTLLESGAVCVHYHLVQSMYSWEGSIHSTNEWRLQIKTGSAGRDNILEHLNAVHPYEVPELLYWPVGAEKNYATWIESSH